MKSKCTVGLQYPYSFSFSTIILLLSLGLSVSTSAKSNGRGKISLPANSSAKLQMTPPARLQNEKFQPTQTLLEISASRFEQRELFTFDDSTQTMSIRREALLKYLKTHPEISSQCPEGESPVSLAVDWRQASPRAALKNAEAISKGLEAPWKLLPLPDYGKTINRQYIQLDRLQSEHEQLTKNLKNHKFSSAEEEHSFRQRLQELEPQIQIETTKMNEMNAKYLFKLAQNQDSSRKEKPMIRIPIAIECRMSRQGHEAEAAAPSSDGDQVDNAGGTE